MVIILLMRTLEKDGIPIDDTHRIACLQSYSILMKLAGVNTPDYGADADIESIAEITRKFIQNSMIESVSLN